MSSRTPANPISDKRFRLSNRRHAELRRASQWRAAETNPATMRRAPALAASMYSEELRREHFSSTAIDAAVLTTSRLGQGRQRIPDSAAPQCAKVVRTRKRTSNDMCSGAAVSCADCVSRMTTPVATNSVCARECLLVFVSICWGSAWTSTNVRTFLSAGAFRVYRHPAELRRSLDELAPS